MCLLPLVAAGIFDMKYEQFLQRANEVGARKAFLETYGDSHTEPKEFAKWLRGLGLTIKEISNLVRMKFGFGCPRLVSRWLDYQKQIKAHREYQRRWRAKNPEKAQQARPKPENLAKAKEAKRLREQGLSYREIAGRLGVCAMTAWNWCNQ